MSSELPDQPLRPPTLSGGGRTVGRPHPVRGRRSTVFKSASSTAAELLAPPPSWPRFRVGAVITGPAQPSQGPGTDGLHPERTRRSATCRVPREMNREECVCCSFVFGGDFARPRAQLLGMAVVRAAPTREPYAHAERRRIRVWRKYWPDLPFHVSQASCTRKRTGYVIFTAVTTGPPLPPAICGLRCSLQLWWQGRRMYVDLIHTFLSRTFPTPPLSTGLSQCSII